MGLGGELSMAARKAAVGRAKQGSISIETVMGGVDSWRQGNTPFLSL